MKTDNYKIVIMMTSNNVRVFLSFALTFAYKGNIKQLLSQ